MDLDRGGSVPDADHSDRHGRRILHIGPGVREGLGSDHAQAGPQGNMHFSPGIPGSHGPDLHGLYRAFRLLLVHGFGNGDAFDGD